MKIRVTSRATSWFTLGTIQFEPGQPVTIDTTSDERYTSVVALDLSRLERKGLVVIEDVRETDQVATHAVAATEEETNHVD
jgi:hypothetical protein